MRPPPTPAVPDTVRPRLGDVPRMVWWSQRAYLYGIRHGTAAERTLSLILALLWWPTCLLLLVVQLAVVGSPASRYYMTLDRDAVIAVSRTKRRGWVIRDHMSAYPGRGCGHDLRRTVLATMCEAADQQGIVIQTTAATQRLAEIYRADLPGLTTVEKSLPRGRRIRREPVRVQGQVAG